MHHGEIHRLVMEFDDRHFDFDANITFLFVFCRAYKAVVKTADNFFFCHRITLQACEDLIEQLHLFLAVNIFMMMPGSCFDQLSVLSGKSMYPLNGWPERKNDRLFSANAVQFMPDSSVEQVSPYWHEPGILLYTKGEDQLGTE